MGLLITKVIMNYEISKLVTLINDHINNSNKDNDSIDNNQRHNQNCFFLP